MRLRTHCESDVSLHPPMPQQLQALGLTFLAYALFHAARKPPSVVKSILARDKAHPSAVQAGGSAGPLGNGWAPFDGADGQSRLGQVDVAFLGAYAVCMFWAGHVGDRNDLRVFLAWGMALSGFLTSLFGLAYFWNLHSMSYFVLVMLVSGAFQATGWPSVVAIMANWYGKGKRGLVMGLWTSHTSIGNIAGTVAAAACLQYGWGYSFVVPGVALSVAGLLVFCLLVVRPEDVGLAPEDDVTSARSAYEAVSTADDDVTGGLGRLGAGGARGGSGSGGHGSGDGSRAVPFWEAAAIPGVAAFSFCLFFSKLIAYTFLYWLPFYVRTTPINGRLLTPKQAGDLSTLFDVGGIAGAVLAGHLSDRTGANALVAAGFTVASVPALFLYRTVGHVSLAANAVLMAACGFLVNGPYSLITTAVSADLGNHESLGGNAQALATVAAIVDGVGSVGAAVGPLLTGYVAQANGFDGVFTMLYLSAIAAAGLLSRLCLTEWQALQLARSNGPGALQMTNIN